MRTDALKRPRAGWRDGGRSRSRCGGSGVMMTLPGKGAETETRKNPGKKKKARSADHTPHALTLAAARGGRSLPSDEHNACLRRVRVVGAEKEAYKCLAGAENLPSPSAHPPTTRAVVGMDCPSSAVWQLPTSSWVLARVVT